MKKMKIILAIAMLGLLQACESNLLNDDLFAGFDTDEGLTLTPVKVDTKKEYEADGTVQMKINFNLQNKTGVAPAKRKVTLSTTIGDFVLNSELKKTAEVFVNDSSLEGFIYFQAPKIAGKALITATTVDNSFVKRVEEDFKTAYPEGIKIDIPSIKLKDSSTTDISATLFRAKGVPSEGLKVEYELFDDKNVLVKNATFSSITKSDANGKTTAKIILEGLVEKTEYRLNLSVKKDDGTVAASKDLRFEVKKK